MSKGRGKCAVGVPSFEDSCVRPWAVRNQLCSRPALGIYRSLLGVQASTVLRRRAWLAPPSLQGWASAEWRLYGCGWPQGMPANEFLCRVPGGGCDYTSLLRSPSRRRSSLPGHPHSPGPCCWAACCLGLGLCDTHPSAHAVRPFGDRCCPVADTRVLAWKGLRVHFPVRG